MGGRFRNGGHTYKQLGYVYHAELRFDQTWTSPPLRQAAAFARHIFTRMAVSSPLFAAGTEPEKTELFPSDAGPLLIE